MMIVPQGRFPLCRWSSLAFLVIFLAGEATPARAENIELIFTYGSEKEAWIKEVTTSFNADPSNVIPGSRKQIQVNAIPIGSGECIQEVLTGKRKAHLTSPASAAFIELGNADSQRAVQKDLIEPVEVVINGQPKMKIPRLVLSPVVIAMWKPMAEAIGWGQQEVGWSDIIDLAKHPDGWSAFNHAEWGAFKLGHTHPEYSNSGLISILAEVYAAKGKKNGLNLDDVAAPATAEYVKAIERAIVHYGDSTGFFSKNMFTKGPQYLSAAVLYENLVIEANSPKYPNLPFPVVAIYPKEGSIWSDHPVGVVNRDWVTGEHRKAATVYINYLMSKPQQEKAMAKGFRPGLDSIEIKSPIDVEHFVNPEELKRELEVPSAEVMRSVIELWRSNRKRTQVTLVMDTSGSMNAEGKLVGAKKGAIEFVNSLDSGDLVTMVTFANKAVLAQQSTSMNDNGKQELKKKIDDIFASGKTALYDAIHMAYTDLEKKQNPDMISAIVVLTDGENSRDSIKLDDLIETIRSDDEKKAIRVFTIKYGKEANKEILEKIASVTNAKSYEAGTGDGSIEEVLKGVRTYIGGR